MPRYQLRRKQSGSGSTGPRKAAALAWGMVLIAVFVVGAFLGPAALFLLINWFAERLTASLVGLVGTRGIELLLGVPMVLFTTWGLLRIVRGKSAPNMTTRQLLAAALTMILFG